MITNLHTLFYTLENDGFDLGAQRRAIDKNDLTEALCILQKYKQTLQENRDVRDMFSDGEESRITTIAEKAKIAKNGDYNLSGERYKKAIAQVNQKWPMVELGVVCEINPKKSEIKTVSPETEVSFVPMSDLSDNGMFFEIMQTKKLSEVLGGYTYFCNNDVLLAKVTPCFENGKSGIARGLKNNIGFGSSEFIVLRSSERIIPELVYRFVSSEKFREIGKPQMTGTGGLQRLPTSFISKFQIPLPPLEVQQEIVAELESYQKIIDGARLVVSNYKPSVKIDPIWEIVRVGDLYDINYGLAISIPQSLDENGIKIISTAETNLDGSLDLTDIRKIKYEKVYDKYILKPGTLLFNWRNAPKHVGKTVIFDEDTEEKIIYASFLLSLVRKTDKVENKWAWLSLNKLREEGYFKRMSKQAVNQTNFNAELLKNTLISLPPLKIQREIVAQIEEEQKLVDANKRLIEIFEQKINDKIAEVWGTDMTPNDDNNASPNGIFKQAQKVQQTYVQQPELGLA